MKLQDALRLVSQGDDLRVIGWGFNTHEPGILSDRKGSMFIDVLLPPHDDTAAVLKLRVEEVQS